MKKFQKIGSLLLAAMMILSLAACSSKVSSAPPAQTPSNGAPAENTPTEAPDDTAAEPDNTVSGSKVLVVYYSASGNTKRVAEDIVRAHLKCNEKRQHKMSPSSQYKM